MLITETSIIQLIAKMVTKANLKIHIQIPNNSITYGAANNNANYAAHRTKIKEADCVMFNNIPGFLAKQSKFLSLANAPLPDRETIVTFLQDANNTNAPAATAAHVPAVIDTDTRPVADLIDSQMDISKMFGAAIDFLKVTLANESVTTVHDLTTKFKNDVDLIAMFKAADSKMVTPDVSRSVLVWYHKIKTKPQTVSGIAPDLNAFLTKHGLGSAFTSSNLTYAVRTLADIKVLFNHHMSLKELIAFVKCGSAPYSTQSLVSLCDEIGVDALALLQNEDFEQRKTKAKLTSGQLNLLSDNSANTAAGFNYLVDNSLTEALRTGQHKLSPTQLKIMAKPSPTNQPSIVQYQQDSSDSDDDDTNSSAKTSSSKAVTSFADLTHTGGRSKKHIAVKANKCYRLTTEAHNSLKHHLPMPILTALTRLDISVLMRCLPMFSDRGMDIFNRAFEATSTTSKLSLRRLHDTKYIDGTTSNPGRAINEMLTSNTDIAAYVFRVSQGRIDATTMIATSFHHVLNYSEATDKFNKLIGHGFGTWLQKLIDATSLIIRTFSILPQDIEAMKILMILTELAGPLLVANNLKHHRQLKQFENIVPVSSLMENAAKDIETVKFEFQLRRTMHFNRIQLPPQVEMPPSTMAPKAAPYSRPPPHANNDASNKAPRASVAQSPGSYTNPQHQTPPATSTFLNKNKKKQIIEMMLLKTSLKLWSDFIPPSDTPGKDGCRACYLYYWCGEKHHHRAIPTSFKIVESPGDHLATPDAAIEAINAGKYVRK